MGSTLIALKLRRRKQSAAEAAQRQGVMPYRVTKSETLSLVQCLADDQTQSTGRRPLAYDPIFQRRKVGAARPQHPQTNSLPIVEKSWSVKLLAEARGKRALRHKKTTTQSQCPELLWRLQGRLNRDKAGLQTPEGSAFSSSSSSSNRRRAKERSRNMEGISASALSSKRSFRTPPLRWKEWQARACFPPKCQKYYSTRGFVSTSLDPRFHRPDTLYPQLNQDAVMDSRSLWSTSSHEELNSICGINDSSHWSASSLFSVGSEGGRHHAWA